MGIIICTDVLRKSLIEEIKLDLFIYKLKSNPMYTESLVTLDEKDDHSFKENERTVWC